VYNEMVTLWKYHGLENDLLLQKSVTFDRTEKIEDFEYKHYFHIIRD
jgi:hypothetical protein